MAVKTQNLYYCVKTWRYEACEIPLFPEGTAWVWRKVENSASVKKYKSKKVDNDWVPTNTKNGKEWDTPPKEQARKGLGHKGSGRSIGKPELEKGDFAGACYQVGSCQGDVYNASNNTSTNVKR